MKNHVAGEIWSLVPSEAREDEPSPLVVLHQDPRGCLVGLPLFSTDTMATDRDLLLSEDPYWLNGDRWCAAHEFVPLSTDRLNIRLGELDTFIYREIQQFIDHGDTRLKRGMRIVPEFLDPTPKWRNEWLAFVDECAGRTRIKDSLKMLLNIWQDFSGSIQAVFRDAVLLPAPQGLASATLRAGDSDVHKQRYKLQVADYEVVVTIQSDRAGWRLAIEVEADELVLRESGREETLHPLGNRWMLPGAKSMESGSYLFQIRGKYGEAEIIINLGDKDK